MHRKGASTVYRRPITTKMIPLIYPEGKDALKREEVV